MRFTPNCFQELLSGLDIDHYSHKLKSLLISSVQVLTGSEINTESINKLRFLIGAIEQDQQTSNQPQQFDLINRLLNVIHSANQATHSCRFSLHAPPVVSMIANQYFDAAPHTLYLGTQHTNRNQLVEWIKRLQMYAHKYNKSHSNKHSQKLVVCIHVFKKLFKANITKDDLVDIQTLMDINKDNDENKRKVRNFVIRHYNKYANTPINPNGKLSMALSALINRLKTVTSSGAQSTVSQPSSVPSSSPPFMPCHSSKKHQSNDQNSTASANTTTSLASTPGTINTKNLSDKIQMLISAKSGSEHLSAFRQYKTKIKLRALLLLLHGGSRQDIVRNLTYLIGKLTCILSYSRKHRIKPSASDINLKNILCHIVSAIQKETSITNYSAVQIPGHERDQNKSIITQDNEEHAPALYSTLCAHLRQPNQKPTAVTLPSNDTTATPVSPHVSYLDLSCRRLHEGNYHRNLTTEHLPPPPSYEQATAKTPSGNRAAEKLSSSSHAAASSSPHPSYLDLLCLLHQTEYNKRAIQSRQSNHTMGTTVNSEVRAKKQYQKRTHTDTLFNSSNMTNKKILDSLTKAEDLPALPQNKKNKTAPRQKNKTAVMNPG